MAADAATLIEKILRQVQSVGALRYAIVRMTHLTAGFSVLFVKQRVQPERILTVSFHRTRGRAAVAAMASGTTEFLRIVNL